MKDWSPFIYLKNNNFTRNIAYIEGNSVYIQGAGIPTIKTI